MSEEKICRDCGVVLVIGVNIAQNKFLSSDYLCKSCKSIRRKEYYKRNKERELKNNKQYRTENPNYFHKYYRDNKNTLMDYYREWLYKNRKNQIESYIKYRQEREEGHRIEYAFAFLDSCVAGEVEV